MLLEARVAIEVEVRLETGVGARLGDTTGAKIEVEGEARLVEEGEDSKFGAEDFFVHACKRLFNNSCSGKVPSKSMASKWCSNL